MRILFVLAILALLFGCSANQDSVMQDRINITFSDMNQTERFDVGTNDSISTLSFVLKNNELFPVDCSVNLNITSNTNVTSKQGSVGVMDPGVRKKVSFEFMIPEGNTSLSIKSDCKRY
jgi:uncharacterized lipoprotein YajG